MKQMEGFQALKIKNGGSLQGYGSATVEEEEGNWFLMKFVSF